MTLVVVAVRGGGGVELRVDLVDELLFLLVGTGDSDLELVVELLVVRGRGGRVVLREDLVVLLVILVVGG